MPRGGFDSLFHRATGAEQTQLVDLMLLIDSIKSVLPSRPRDVASEPALEEEAPPTSVQEEVTASAPSRATSFAFGAPLFFSEVATCCCW